MAPHVAETLLHLQSLSLPSTFVCYQPNQAFLSTILMGKFFLPDLSPTPIKSPPPQIFPVPLHLFPSAEFVLIFPFGISPWHAAHLPQCPPFAPTFFSGPRPKQKKWELFARAASVSLFPGESVTFRRIDLTTGAESRRHKICRPL